MSKTRLLQGLKAFGCCNYNKIFLSGRVRNRSDENRIAVKCILNKYVREFIILIYGMQEKNKKMSDYVLHIIRNSLLVIR